MTREWYRHVARWINSAFRSERKWQRERLLLGTWAMLQRRSVCLSELARALPGKTSHHHKKKRLYRFFSQGEWEALSLLGEAIPTVLRRFGIREGKVPLSVDWTPLRPGEQALVAALPLQGRGIPLQVWATSWEKIRRGTGQPDLEQAFLRRVVASLPEGIEPVVVADRGFGHVRLLRFLQELKRVLGRPVHFVIRLSGKIEVEHRGRRRLLREGLLSSGETRFLEGVWLRQDRAVRVNLVLIWEKGKKEPWYLATDLDDPQEAIRLYRQRAWIDEMFRDWKQHFRLEESRVFTVERLERLLVVLVIAYWVLAWVGLFAVGPAFVQQVISWGRASFVFLALEYLRSHDPPPRTLVRKRVR